jgi:hypothetical protein
MEASVRKTLGEINGTATSPSGGTGTVVNNLT